jgi:hypothetical protein
LPAIGASPLLASGLNAAAIGLPTSSSCPYRYIPWLVRCVLLTGRRLLYPIINAKKIPKLEK